MLTATASEIIVLGGGIVGSTIASAAARRGHGTLLLERYRVGFGGATRASGGIVRSYHHDPRLNDRAARALHTLAPCPEFVRTGFLCLEPPCDVERAHAEVERLRLRYRIELELLSPEALARRYPMLNCSGIGVGVLEANAGFVDPIGLARRLADDAREHGARVVEGVAVRALHVASDSQIEVDTSLGALRTRTLVLAAGAASAAILASLNEPHALRSKGIRARHLVTNLEQALPCAFEDRTTGLYGRPLGAGRSLVGLPTSDWDVPADASPPLLADPEFQGVLARRLPSYGDALSEGGRYAVDAYTEDGLGVVRRSRRAPNVIIATGFSGSGVKLAPWAAERVFELLEEGALKPTLSSAAARSPAGSW